MTDFAYDCLQKKRLAQQAKYRKNGSKSKKCTLPSDRLTNRQWKERCGPVMSYSMGVPVVWDAFKNFPLDIQKEYITSLQNKYGATATDLGKMFGVKALTVRKHSDKYGLGLTFPRGHSMNPAERAEWRKFLGEEEEVVETVAAHADETVSKTVVEVHDEDEAPALETVQVPEDTSAPPAAAPVEPNATTMTQVSLKFSGAINIDMIANSLRQILGNQSSGELEIICNLA